jgi:hypothetical protein
MELNKMTSFISYWWQKYKEALKICAKILYIKFPMEITKESAELIRFFPYDYLPDLHVKYYFSLLS